MSARFEDLFKKLEGNVIHTSDTPENHAGPVGALRKTSDKKFQKNRENIFWRNKKFTLTRSEGSGKVASVVVVHVTLNTGR